MYGHAVVRLSELCHCQQLKDALQFCLPVTAQCTGLSSYRMPTELLIQLNRIMPSQFQLQLLQTSVAQALESLYSAAE